MKKKKLQKKLFALSVDIDLLKKQVNVLLPGGVKEPAFHTTTDMWMNRVRNTDTPLFNLIKKDAPKVNWGFTTPDPDAVSKAMWAEFHRQAHEISPWDAAIKDGEMRTPQEWRDVREADRKYKAKLEAAADLRQRDFVAERESLAGGNFSEDERKFAEERERIWATNPLRAEDV